jgi:polyhydroxyalkanoate synthesis regulator phasin
VHATDAIVVAIVVAKGRKIMSQEQMKVLQMLDEGKLTADEATTLLQKLATPVTTATEMTKAMTKATNAEPSSVWADMGEWLRRLLSLVVKEKVEEQADSNYKFKIRKREAGVQVRVG